MSIPVSELEQLLQLPEYQAESEKLKRANSTNGYHGINLLHLNATHVGGGVVEVNNALIPSLQLIGINAEWLQISTLLDTSTEEMAKYFTFTKSMHNLLQGKADTDPDFQSGKETYVNVNRQLAQTINFSKYDVVIVDDPQPAAVEGFARELLGERREQQTWLWRCHIDLTQPNPEALETLLPHLKGYDGAIFTMDAYVPQQLRGQMPILTMSPGINPYTVKNRPMSGEEAYDILSQRVSIDKDRPLIVQVSRFDPWKDQVGLIDAYRLAKERVPGLQLLLMAAGAADDPEGKVMHDLILEKAGFDPDIHVYLNDASPEETDLVTGAAQRLPGVFAPGAIIQNSIREGYGLVVSEALWKGVPVIATNVGGIPLQVQHEINGLLVNPNSPGELADAIVDLVRRPEYAKRLGEAGQQGVHTTSDVALDYALQLPALIKRPVAELHQTVPLDTTYTLS